MSINTILQQLGIQNINGSGEDGKWVNFSCPIAKWQAAHGFTEDKNPSAGAIVADDGNVYWKCFTCGGHGNLLNLVGYMSKKTGKDYSNLIEKLLTGVSFRSFDDYYVFSSTKELPNPIPDYVYSSLFTEKLTLDAAKYLHSRGISGSTAKKVGIVYDPSGRITVPYMRDGQVYGWAGRAIYDHLKPKVKNYTFDISKFFLGEHLWTYKPTILVEGVFAYLKLHELGFSEDYDIAALSGVTCSDHQAEILYKKDLPVYLMLDGDLAGREGTKKCAEKLKEELLVFVTEYGDIKDIDYLTKEQISSMLTEAKMFA